MGGVIMFGLEWKSARNNLVPFPNTYPVVHLAYAHPNAYSYDGTDYSNCLGYPMPPDTALQSQVRGSEWEDDDEDTCHDECMRRAAIVVVIINSPSRCRVIGFREIYRETRRIAI